MSNPLRSNKRESFRLLEKKTQLLKLSLEQVKLAHFPSVSFKTSIQVFKRFKQLFYHQLESLLSRLKEVSNLSVNSWMYLFIALQEEPTSEPKRKLFKKAAKLLSEPQVEFLICLLKVSWKLKLWKSFALMKQMKSLEEDFKKILMKSSNYFQEMYKSCFSLQPCHHTFWNSLNNSWEIQLWSSLRKKA